jgi:hypothetical protein
MKPLSRTSKIAALTAIGVTSAFLLRSFAQPPTATSEPDRTFILKIKKEHQYKDEKKFDAALDGLSAEAIYKIRKKYDDGTVKDKESKKNVRIKTDKVTTSEVAKVTAGDELTAIGAHVTQQVASNSAADITKVLAQLTTE